MPPPHTTYTFNIPTIYINVQSSVGFYKVAQRPTGGQGHVAYPTSHLEDANKLESDAYVELFQITLIDKVTKIFQKVDNTVTWQGDTYEGTSIKLTGVAQYADDQTSRPQLLLYNPDNVFNALVDQGALIRATVARYRILKTDLDADRAIYRRQQWIISRVPSMKGNTIACELRDMMDGQIFVIPARMYIPPDFPAVST